MAFFVSVGVLMQCCLDLNLDLNIVTLPSLNVGRVDIVFMPCCCCGGLPVGLSGKVEDDSGMWRRGRFRASEAYSKET